MCVYLLIFSTVHPLDAAATTLDSHGSSFSLRLAHVSGRCVVAGSGCRCVSEKGIHKRDKLLKGKAVQGTLQRISCFLSHQAQWRIPFCLAVSACSEKVSKRKCSPAEKRQCWSRCRCGCVKMLNRRNTSIHTNNTSIHIDHTSRPAYRPSSVLENRRISCRPPISNTPRLLTAPFAPLTARALRYRRTVATCDPSRVGAYALMTFMTGQRSRAHGALKLRACCRGSALV